MSFMNNGETKPNVPFTNPDEVKLEDLVGEGKKYADEQALAKALAHSQNHIFGLEKGMEDLRTDLTTRTTVEDALKELASKSAPAPAEPATPAAPVEPAKEATSQGLSPEDIQKTIEETLKARESESAKASNLAEAQSTLQRIYGSEADQYVETKAKELGISVDHLISQAQASPTAFFKLLDINTKEQAPTDKRQTYTRPTVKRAPDPNLLETKEDYLALRRKNPTKFWSPKVQQDYLKLELSKLE